MSTYRTENVGAVPTHDILDDVQSHDRVDRVLQSIYYSRKCQFFYIGLLLACTVLIILTIVDGFKIAGSPAFICVELLLNLVITIDFVARIKLQGFKTYLNQSVWNKLDLIIVAGCNTLFLVSVIDDVTFGEISDELLLVFWSVG